MLHVAVSLSLIENVTFLKHFIPQTWFTGRIFLSSMLLIVISKYSIVSPFRSLGSENKENDDEGLSTIQRKEDQDKLRKNTNFLYNNTWSISRKYRYNLVIRHIPYSVLDNYSLHRPYEIPTLGLFSLTLFFFFRNVFT